MNITTQNNPSTVDLVRLARAMQVALIAIVLGLSYYAFRVSLTIPTFQQIYVGMLNGKPLPSLTIFVFYARVCLLAASLLVPLLALGTLFFRNRVRSIYFLAALAIVVIGEFILLCNGLSSPLFEVISLMQGGRHS